MKMIACLIGTQRNESKGETNVRLRINSGIKAITENESRGANLIAPDHQLFLNRC
jgi:hypothetical protein